jgi:hypothetical protein
MYLRLRSFTSLLLLPGLLLFAGGLSSCSKKKAAPVPDASDGTYYSIRSFARDQWNTFKEQPYVLSRTITFNGARDSALVQATDVPWGQIFKMIAETDISDPKFLDKYNFTMFVENMTQTRNFLYEAKDPALFTQKLQIAADMFNNKIRSVYIETAKKSFWNSETQKFLYSPVTSLQIQQHSDPLIGSSKDLVIDYKFL